TGDWTGTMCLTEPQAGTDVGNLKTKAIRQPDGTFKLQGTKLFITAGDHDLTENIIHPVLARIEGDPAGTDGISIFIVPKYLINADGSLGRRNDYAIGSIEEKMGLHGSSTCLMNFGDNNECYAELLGEERQGIKIMFQMMNEARIGVGLQGLTAASAAYLHALQYAKERLQGATLLEMRNPDAQKVPIINHADVRRMLIWMKGQTEGMRALMFYTAFCVDQVRSLEEGPEKEKYLGLIELLTPICKAFCSDMGFRVTETAIQVYGGYGYCSEYPVEQFLRDEKIASLYEGTNGIQALDLVGRKLGMKKGMYFMNLLGEMGATIARYKDEPGFADLAEEVQGAVNTLAEVSMFFAKSAKEGKFMIPVANAYPFLMMMGKVLLAWLLLWEAGAAREKLAKLCGEAGVDIDDVNELAQLIKKGDDAAFYDGKIKSARYYMKHVLPEVEAAAKSIKGADLSMLDIADESFAF
ncbi:MAG: acyl-CoA dehydrogenase, partial [Smithellaceae bacterium]|nr:acyl-CoA dehydrogenase [Smithellaceae bacterium]